MCVSWGSRREAQFAPRVSSHHLRRWCWVMAASTRVKQQRHACGQPMNLSRLDMFCIAGMALFFSFSFYTCALYGWEYEQKAACW